MAAGWRRRVGRGLATAADVAQRGVAPVTVDDMPLAHRVARLATTVGLRGDTRWWPYAERFGAIPGSAPISAGGPSFDFDLRDPTIGPWLYRGQYERLSLGLVRELVEPGWFAVDIGAHQGVYTVALASWVGPTGSVLAIEPNPAFTARHEHLAARLGNVDFAPVAIGEESGIQTLVHDGSAYGLGHLARQGEATTAAAGDEVDVRPLAEVLAPHPRPPDLFKIDVEGAELTILQQIAALPVMPHAVLVEIWSSFASDETRVVLGELEAKGLSPYLIGRVQGRLLNRRTARRVQVDDIGRSVEGNLLLLDREPRIRSGRFLVGL